MTTIDVAEGSHLQRKESEYLLKPDSSSMLNSREMVIPGEGDYPESSPQEFTGILEGKNVNKTVSSLAAAEHTCSGHLPVDDAGIMVEELTLRNYNGANLAVVGPSNNRDRMQIRQNQWQHIHLLAGGQGTGSSVRDSVRRDNGQPMSSAWEDVGYSSFPEFLAQKQSSHDHNEVREQVTNCENRAVSGDTLSPGGIRTKILSKSGFSEFFIKNSLKGKGVICRGPARDGFGVEIRDSNNTKAAVDTTVASDSSLSPSAKTATPSPRGLAPTRVKSVICTDTVYDGFGDEFRDQNNTKAIVDSQVASDLSLSSSAKTAVPSAHGSAGTGPCHGPLPDSSHDGVNLREWLRAGHRKINKVESLYIFRQIVDLVDVSHSQGVAMQNLRPSCFKLLPSNQVAYLGSSVQREMLENAVDQDVSLKNLLSGKRSLEKGMFPSISLSGKKQKFSESMNTFRQWPQFSARYGIKLETANKSGINITRAQDLGSKFNEEHNQNTEYKIQRKSSSQNVSYTSQQLLISASDRLEEKWYTSPMELSEGVCTFSSNIYCLGVLLFELLGSFDSEKARAAAVSDLRHRILPPNFLSENPKEAGFCLWLLHPESSSRPTTREILQSEVISGLQEVHEGDLSSSIEQEDVDSELLLHFLILMKEQKHKHATKLVEDIRCLEADIEEVERRTSPKKSSLLSCSHKTAICASEKRFIQEGTPSAEACSEFPHFSDTYGLRLMRNISQLESAYFSMRSKIQLPETDALTRSDKDLLLNRENFYQAQKNGEDLKVTDRLGTFFNGLCKYARYSKFEVRGILRNGDFINSANVICSLSFDRDEDYLAAAGVSKKIKIFEFHALFNDSVDIHYPVIEMTNKSKLSCICWNNYIKNYLASTDYDGVVKLWDASTGQGLSQYIDHQKRAWSVDFSRVDPKKLASGSDDCSVKLWSINEKNCLGTIRNIANVCCVQFSAHSSHLLAFGSADYKTYCYDLRNAKSPWCILAGHDKAVSYVKFLDAETLVSASTDNSLKIWDLNQTSSTGLSMNACSLTLSGHTNEKNFVGLSVADGYVTCGSETNEVYAYHRSLPMPITSHKFGSIDPISGKETDDDNGQFVSSVCWRGKSNMVVAANSTGCIKVLEMV